MKNVGMTTILLVATLVSPGTGLAQQPKNGAVRFTKDAITGRYVPDTPRIHTAGYKTIAGIYQTRRLGGTVRKAGVLLHGAGLKGVGVAVTTVGQRMRQPGKRVTTTSIARKLKQSPTKSAFTRRIRPARPVRRVRPLLRK